MPTSTLPEAEDVDKLFEDRLDRLKRIVRRQCKTNDAGTQSERLVEAIAAFIRSRWDNAASLHSWYEWGGRDESAVGLNFLYEALGNLGVDLHLVLRLLFTEFGWLARAIGIIDDTSIRKYGKRTPGVSLVHVANVKGGVPGHNLVTLMLQDEKGSSFFDIRQKMNQKVPKSARRKGPRSAAIRRMQETTKHQLAKEMISNAVKEGVSLTHLLFDAWYFCAATAEWFENEVHLKFVSRAKKNQPFIIDDKETTVEEFLAGCRSWRRVRQTDHFCYQKTVTLKNGLTVKIVAVWFFRGRSLKKTSTVLVTNDLSLSAAEVVLLYLSRWSTELGYKLLKHNLAWGNYQGTDENSISNAQQLGLIAYALASSVKEELNPGLGMPTLLELRKRAKRTQTSTTDTGAQDPNPMIATTLSASEPAQLMMAA